tara:strand:+ start:535 stop:870 length:336 start_codon:yes stop_codon:yes gene_type:complete
MSRLEIILSSVLMLSVLFNIGLIVYVRSAVVRLLWVSEELGDLQSMTTSFSNHIQSVYEMEMFYGDETLGSLMEHARSYDEQLETFAYIYSLTDKEEMDPDGTNEEADQEA